MNEFLAHILSVLMLGGLFSFAHALLSPENTPYTANEDALPKIKAFSKRWLELCIYWTIGFFIISIFSCSGGEVECSRSSPHGC